MLKRLFLILSVVLTAALMSACGGGNEAASGTIAEGQPAPDFTLPATRGGEVSLSDYAGQPVLLYFHMAVG